MTLLAATGIVKSFGGNVVLRSVDFSLRPGEIVGLLGENGAGKSTLMNTLAGSLRPDAGTLRIDGELVRFRSVLDAMRAGIRFVHQELSLVGALSVAENIFLGEMPTTRAGLVDFRGLREGAQRALTRIGASHIDPRAEAGSLRPGEQQLVEIARALSRNPRLLILDEPTSSLAGHEAAAFLAAVRVAAAAGTAVVFITHRLDEALQTCDRLVILRNGEVVGERDPRNTTRDALIADMTGRPALFEQARQGMPSDEIALALADAGDGALVSGITLAVRKGEVFGLYGLVGAGRTEVLELLCGARSLRSGSISIRGKQRAFARPGAAWAAGLALVPEGRKTHGILPQHSVRRNVSIASLGALSTLGFVRQRFEREGAAAYYGQLGVRMGEDTQPITTLSGGNQQKVLFARALMARPSILLLDEPTQGVDVGAKAEIYSIIRGAADAGTSVLVASSEIQELLGLCDRVAVLSKGRLAGVLGRAEMTEQSVLTLGFKGH